MKKSCKSQAGIIVAVLLVLIVLVSVIIVWNIVIPILKARGGEVDIEKLTTSYEVNEVIVFVGGASRISVSRKAGGGDVDGLKFVFYDNEGGSYVVDKTEDLLGELETKTYNFAPPENIGTIIRVSVVPVVGKNIGREFDSNVKEAIEIPRGLVSWYRFDDESDFLGRNNGELIDSELQNGGLILNGGGYFDGGNSSGFNMYDEVSLSFWVKPESLGGDVIIKGDSNKNYGVSINSSGNVILSLGTEDVLGSYLKIPTGSWSHVVVSVDFNGVKKVYINNEAASFFTDLPTSPNVNNDDLAIGRGFRGGIDEVMVFNKSLSDNNVNSLYNLAKFEKVPVDG